MPAIESRIASVWWAKQPAKGTAATTADKRGRLVGGDMTVNRDDGNENYTDGQRFPSAADFVNSIIGNGNPALQGQPGVIGHLAYLMSGAETVTGASAPFTHVATPSNAGSFWSSWWKSLGATVGPLRQKFNDCRLTSLRLEGSTAAKVVRAIPTWVSLDAGEIFTTDPIKVDDNVNPLLYTQAEGAFRVNGTVIRAHSSFAFVINDNVTPWYGDSVLPHDVALGAGQVAIENITLLVDQNGYEHYLREIYGTTAPAAGAKPTKVVPALGSWEATFTQDANNSVKIELPGVKWTPDMNIPPNPDGGAVELTVGAEARKSGANPMYRVTTVTADPAYT